MDISLRVVSQIPLECLWTDNGLLDIKRERYLDQHEIRALFKSGPVQLIIANLGNKLNWLPIKDSYKIYKTDLHDHIINNPDSIHLESLPGNFGYLASLWTGTSNAPIILLEMFH
ncbi:hypothetical protein Q4E93_19840 [Flavitalea sp. BT771]|uniref:hypothetical protein n=1 Tax=Flavitalea sp. BT771 TaxID=3063329 RepID=UPI0026E3A5E9|nr:hypothetical protein [Flavitalea sp. BT771]MDO6432870.1 hypothetical protein [Flavitalea sp. BT771]MDV6221854.1 hypothetical protein [Flavitalea sp. BT771]